VGRFENRYVHQHAHRWRACCQCGFCSHHWGCDRRHRATRHFRRSVFHHKRDKRSHPPYLQRLEHRIWSTGEPGRQLVGQGPRLRVHRYHWRRVGDKRPTPFSETDNRFVGTSSRFGSNGNQSNALTSGPRLLDTGNHTRMFFDDAFQNIRLLGQDQRNTLIIEAGVFNLPEIPDFTGETYATSVQVRGHSGFGFPARSNTLQLAPPPAPVPVPAALSLLMSAFCGLGLISWRRTRTAAS
jgi:hypothetical protein